jgi:hypothetical protein
VRINKIDTYKPKEEELDYLRKTLFVRFYREVKGEEADNLRKTLKIKSFACALKIDLAQLARTVKYPGMDVEYINKEIAEQMAKSWDPLINEWGGKCSQFYATNPLVTSKDFKFVQLISPVHVAALMGSVEFLEKYRDTSSGKKPEVETHDDLTEKRNHWEIEPLELAIRADQREVVKFIMENSKRRGQNKFIYLAVDLVIKYGSFEMIEFCLSAEIKNRYIRGSILNGPQINLAYKRDKNLGDFLLQTLIAEHIAKASPYDLYKAFLLMLEYSTPIPQLVDFLTVYPIISVDTNPHIFHSEGKDSKNTLLHHLILRYMRETPYWKSTRAQEIKNYLSAIFIARLSLKSQKDGGYNLKGPKGVTKESFDFDIEAKNAAGKTVLQLAFETQNKDLISAVMLYGNPDYTGLEKELMSANINIPSIIRERAELQMKVTQNIIETQLETVDKLSETVQNQAVMAAQLGNEIEGLKATVQNQAALAADLHQTKQVLAALFQALGVSFSPAISSRPAETTATMGLIEPQADVRELSQLFARLPVSAERGIPASDSSLRLDK